jgi:hypothetical protein
MRRYKNQRKYRRASKTFRQRKPLNLHRSSMKKLIDPRKVEWIGGTDPEEKVPLVVKPASDETTEVPTQEKITTFTLGSDEVPVSAPAPVPESAPATEQAPAPATEQAPAPESEQAPAPESEQAPAPATTTETTSITESTTESEQAPAPAPLPESAPMPESGPEQAPVNAVESASAPEPEPEPEPTKVDTIPTADAVPKQMDAENVKPESSAPPSVADALNLIADKIATAVVNKMREGSASGSSSNQDADIAVPLAVSAVVKQTQLAPE